MKATHQKPKHNITSSPLGGACGAAKAKLLQVQESTLAEVPVGCRVGFKSVSFSKLETGDFILVSLEDQISVRRFVRLHVGKGSTRLIVADGQRAESSIPFTRLLGLVSSVRLGENQVNPNPSNFFYRAAFRLAHSFTRVNSVA